MLGTAFSYDRVDKCVTSLHGFWVVELGRPTDLRPFVRDGSPFACEVFIVGLNAAFAMKAGFWDFWQVGVGFNKPKWFEAYKFERMSRLLKPGRTRSRAISNSRRVSE